MLKIKSPAILGTDGKIYEGKSHDLILKTNKASLVLLEGEKGFVDSLGTFHNREESAQIAYISSQIKEQVKFLQSYHLNQE